MNRNTKTSKNLRKRAGLLAAALVGMGIWAGQAQAGPLDWDPGIGNAGTNGTALGGDGNWVSDGSFLNWYLPGTGDVVWDSTDAIFNGTPGTVTVTAGGVNASSMKFDSSYTVQGGAVSLTGGATALTSNATSTINSNINIVTNAGTITSNAGTLTLGGANLDAGGLALTFTGLGNTTVSNVIANAASVTKSSLGTVTLSGASTHTGLTTISQGTLRIGAAGDGTNSPLGTTGAGTTVSASGAALDVNGITLSTAEPLTLNGTGISTGGALTNNSGTATFSGPITLGSAAAIGAGGGATLTVTGGISGAFPLTFAGAGNIKISTTALNANVTPITKMGSGGLTIDVASTSVTAPISVNAGTFTLSGNGQLGDATGSITYSSVNAGRTDGSALSSGTLPAGFQVGSFVLGQAIYQISNTTTYTSGNPVGFASGAQTYHSGVMALPGGAIVVDNSGVNVNYRFGGSSTAVGRGVALGGASLTFTPSNSGAVAENLAGLVLMQGHSVITLNADPGYPTDIKAAILNQRGTTTETALIRGSSLGSAAGNGVATLTFTAAPTFIGSTTTGGGTTAQGMLPYVIVGTSPTSYGTRFATTSGANQVLRPLAAGEMDAAAYTSGKNILQAGAQPSISAGVSINSLTIDSGNVTITNPAFPTVPPTLTISSGGLLSTSAASTISGGILALSNQMDIFTPGANAAANVLTISSRLTGSGLVKAGGGTLLLTSTSPAYPGYSQNTINSYGNHAGSVYINDGTVKLGAHNAIGQMGNTSQTNDGNSLTLDPGGILDLNGKTQFVGALSTGFSGDNSPTGPTGLTGGRIIGSGNILVATGNPGGGPVSFVYAGTVEGSVGFSVQPGGAARQELTGQNTSTGPVLFDNTPQTVLRDYGTISAASQISINSANGLRIDNTGLANINGRLNPSGQLIMNSGTLTYLGRAQTNSTESAGALQANTGYSTITVTPGGTNVNSADLTFSSLATNGGTINFQAGGGTLGSGTNGNPHINITSATVASLQGAGVMVNNIIPWATVGGANFASYTPYTSVNGVTSGGIISVTGQSGTFPANATTPTVDYNGGGGTITGDSNINSVRMTGFQNIAFTAGTETLNITSGGLFVDGSIINTIGATLDSGRLTAGGTASTGTSNLYAFQSNRGYVINSRIIDNPNGAKVRLVTGSTELALRDANTYTGGTIINGNTVYLINAASGTSIPNATTPADGLVVNGATLNQQNSVGQIGSSNIVTLNGNSTVNLFGNNTLAGLVINNIGNGAPTFNTTPTALQTSQYGVTGYVNSSPDITLTLTGGITTTSNNIGSIATINGRVSLPSSTTINVGAATFNGLAINPWSADLNLTGVVGGGGTITKSGAGVLQFTQPTTLTGMLDVTAGGVQVANVANAGARLADVVLENGAWLNLAGQDGLFGSLAAPGTGVVTNSGGIKTLTVGFDNASTTFAGSFQRFNDSTLNLINLTKIGTGTMTLTGNSSTASGTMTLNSTSGGGVTFKDAGINNFLSGTVTVNAGSTLALDNNSGLLNGGTGAYVANRLANAAVNLGLTLNGGNFTYQGRNDTASSENTGTGNLTLGSGESTVTANAGTGGSGTGTSLVTFNGLTQNAGSTGTFAGTGIGTATNKVVFTGAPGLTNNILPRLAVGTDFATYNQDGAGAVNTNGIQAVSSYTIPTDINTAVTANNVKVTAAVTSRNLTAARTVNSLNITDSGVTLGTTGAILPTQGLTIGSGGMIVNSTGATISTPVLAENAEGIFRVNSGADLNVNSRITGTAGITKTGTGSLTLSQPQEYTGTTTVNQGTLKLGAGLGKNPLLVTVTSGNPSAPTLQMNGGTFDLNGNSMLVGSIQSVNPYAGGTVTNTAGGAAATLTSFIGGDTTFGGKITGNLNFDFKGSGNFGESIFTLKDQQSYTGTTSIRSGILLLQDKGALYSGVADLTNASVALNHATIRFDNSGLNPSATPPTRIPSTVPITLNYGVIQTIAGASADNVNTLGTVTVDRGLNLVALNAAQANTGTVISNGQGATNTLTINNLANNANGGLVNLFAYSNQLGAYPNSQAQRLFITNVNGSTVTAGAMLPPWVGIGNGTGNGTLFTDFATLSSTGFGIVGYGDTALNGPGYAGTFASGNVTSVGATALSAASTTTKALKLTGALTFSAATNVLNLESGGLITIGQSIGGAANSGHLTAGGASPSGTVDLVLANGSASGMTVNSIIEDNGSAKVRLILTDGNGTMTLTGNNTYSGGTIISAGREGQSHFILGGTGVIIPAGGLIIQPNINNTTQRAFTTTAAGQIHPSNDVTIMSSGYGLTMATGTTNTLSSLIFNNNGGGRTSNTPLVDTGGTGSKLILTKTTANGSVINSNNDSLSSIPKIQGAELNLPDGATITTSGEAPVDLNIATTALTTAAATLPLHKAGAGSVMFTPQSSFANGMNLDGGTIIFTANSVGGGTGGTAPTTSQIGTGTLTIADGTAIMSDNNRSIGNVVAVADNAGFTFGTLAGTNARANATNNLTLTNTVTLGAGAHTINVNGLNMTGTISGKLTGGTNLTKGGPGTLVLNNAANDFGGTITVNGGTLQQNVAGSIPTGRVMTVASGAAFNLNAIAASIDSLNGAGLVFNTGGAAALTINGSASGTFSGVLAATTAANLSLVKSGSNTQTLSGANLYTGATSVSDGGKLLLGQGGSMAATAVSVNNTATYGLSQTSSGTTISAGGSLALASGTTLDMQDSHYNTMAFTGTGSMSGATFKFDLGTLAANADKLTIAGAANTTPGGNMFSFNMLGGTLDTTTPYTLITAASGLTLGDFGPASTVLGAYTLTLTGGGNNISLSVISNNTYNWKGSGSDWHDPANWNNAVPIANNAAIFSDAGASGATSTADLGSTDGSAGGLTFNTSITSVTIASASGGKLILNNGASIAPVNVTGSHQITAPMSLLSDTTVNTPTLSDSLTINSAIDGSKNLTKNGAGALTLGGTNTNFTGGTTITAGTLRTTNLYALGNPGNVIFAPFLAATVNVQSGGTLHVDVPGIKLANLTVNGTVTTTSLAVGGAGSTGNIELGTVDGSGNTVVAGTLTLGSTGLIDLQDRMLIVHYTQDSIAPSILDGPATAIKAALVQGRNVAPGGVFDGPWTGTAGITSSRAASDFSTAHINTGSPNTEFYALGYGDTGKQTLGDGTITNKMLINDAGPNFFDPTANGGRGAGVGSTVFVRYTRVGDATMDGIVGNNDVTVLGLNFDPTYIPVSNPNGPKQWYDGDFNYNGIVDNNDVTILGLQFDPTNTSAVLYSSLVSQYGSSFAASFAQGYAQSHPTASLVPEPGALTLLGVGALALIRRRRA